MRPATAWRPCLYGLLAAAVFACVGCGPNAQIGGIDRYAATTPDAYCENRLFPLVPVPNDQNRLTLTPAHRLSGETDRANFVQHNEPLGVIVNGFYLPKSKGSSSRRDIAVVLDLSSSNSNAVYSLVVFYQRNVAGGTKLNFRDLLVFCDPAWDSNYAPHFRVRVLDVKAEKNERTRELLEQASRITSGLGGLMPTPEIVPAVGVAIEAAKLLLANARNEVFLDFTVQFYSHTQAAAAGCAPLNTLRRGPWLVIGRPIRDDSSFFTKTLYLNLQSEGIETDSTGTDKSVEVPYLSVTVMTAAAVVPSIVAERSVALTGLLSSSAGKGDLEYLSKQGELITGGVATYIAVARFSRARDMKSLNAIIALLESKDSTLSDRDRNLLMATVQRAVPTEHLDDIDAVLTWLNTKSQNGRIDPATGVWRVLDTQTATQRPPLVTDTGDHQ